jgi:Tfp pilus assembly protein PilV
MIVRPSARLLSRLRSARGYTAVEVLLAMTVLLIGSASVMSMQKASIQGNLDARKLDLANSIAHDWLERLAADATTWTLPATNVTGASNAGNTLWVGNAAYPYSQPFLPLIPGAAAAAESQSPAFDILGRGLTAGNAAGAVFCVHVNLVPLSWDTMAPPNPLIIRATVLVFWPKQLVNSGAVPAGYCTTGTVLDPAAAEAASPGTWHLVYATTAIRRTPVL